MHTYTAPKPGSKIIIVGGGCFGLSTAYTLSLSKEKNYDIWVYDRESIPVRDAASNDISKVVRMDYGDARLYTDLAIDSIDIWNQWNQERKAQGLVPVYHNTGLLVFSGEDKLCENELHSLKHIRAAGHNDWIEELSPQELVSRYPFFENAVKNGISAAYYNKVGGWCNSAEAIKHIYQKCQDNGVKFVLGDQGCFTQLITQARSVVGIKTKDGQSHLADRVVMCTGSWTSSVIDMHDQVIATGQVVIHFRPTEQIKEALKDLPVWFGDFSRAGFYGFPDNGHGVMKIAKHATGYLNPRPQDGVSVPRTQVTHEHDTIPVQAVKDFRTYLAKFLPITNALDITYARVCWYSDSIDGDFIVSPHPDYDNLVVAAGDSGHAMKFLPMMGTRIVEVIENQENEYTKAWAWRKVQPRQGFYDRPLLVDEHHTIRMVTQAELRSSKL
ncbi:hypothetical protein CU098_009984 [Rhizopus stolonifer]|uniref:FAD dependent oxidoreductase domain-containing protein n=1 Tax=Rhizopus stolonifer TaxID=4846 RepID=A0A367KRC6_RHIST|nr:hypothetical protein CU098_009984 [Rhizopus stolonifer]